MTAGRSSRRSLIGRYLRRCGRTTRQFKGWERRTSSSTPAVGQFGLDTLAISTRALKSGSPSHDSQYTLLENQLTGFNTQRNRIAGQMATMLENATFNHQAINEQQARSLIAQADVLLIVVHLLARN